MKKITWLPALLLLVSALCGGHMWGSGLARTAQDLTPKYVALDLLAAYLPMAWLGIQIGTRMKHGNDGARERLA